MSEPTNPKPRAWLAGLTVATVVALTSIAIVVGMDSTTPAASTPAVTETSRPKHTPYDQTAPPPPKPGEPFPDEETEDPKDAWEPTTAPKPKPQRVEKNGTVTRAEWKQFNEHRWDDDGCYTVQETERLFGARAKRTGTAYGAFRTYEWRGTKRSGVDRYVISFYEGCSGTTMVWPR